MRNQKQLRAAIYARFSTDMQNPLSADDQIALCTTYAERQGWRVVEAYADRALTGTTDRRHEFQRLIEDGKAGRFDIILAEDLDRLNRDLADTATYYKRLQFAGIKLWTVADGEINEMHVGLKGTMNELFIKNLAAKTHRGQAGRLRAGKIPGGNSYGYAPVPGKPGEVTIDQEQAKVVRRIFAEMIADGSPKAISAGLNREHIPSPTGRDWNPNTIRGSGKWGCGILRNAQYVGRIVWNRTKWLKDPDTKKKIRRLRDPADVMTSNVPELRIIEESDWNKVQALLAERAQPENRRRPTRPTYLLSGLVRCGVCDNAYVASGGRGHVPRFICTGRKEKGVCTNRLISCAEIEERVTTAIRSRLLAPEAIKRALAAHAAKVKAAETTGREARQRIEKRLGTIARELKNLVAALGAAGARAPQTIVERMNALEAEQGDLTDKLGAKPADSNVVPMRVDRYLEKVADLPAALTHADPAVRAKAFTTLRRFVEAVLVYPADDPQGRDIELHGTIEPLLQDPAPAKPAARMVESARSVSSHRRPRPGPAAFRRIVAA